MKKYTKENITKKKYRFENINDPELHSIISDVMVYSEDYYHIPIEEDIPYWF